MHSTSPAPVIAAVDGSESSTLALRTAAEYAATGLDPESWTRCHFGYAASGSVAEAAAS